MVIDSIARPLSFRQATVPKLGEFASAGADRKLAQWLATFDVIAALTIVADTLLVVTHGTMHRTPACRFDIRHERVDVYYLPKGEPIAHDLALPQASQVLGGGQYFYLLVRQPPDPWTIQRIEIVPNYR